MFVLCQNVIKKKVIIEISSINNNIAWYYVVVSVVDNKHAKISGN